MAYQTVSGSANTGSFRSFAKFADGENIEGYFLGMTTNRKFPVKTDLNLQLEDGTIVKLARAGQLNYLERNLEEQGIELVVGAMTRITRTGSYTPKGRTQESPRARVEQDLTRVLDTIPNLDELDNAVAATTDANIKDRISKLKAEAKA